MSRTATLLAGLALTLALGVGYAPAAQAETDDCDTACVTALRDQVLALSVENANLRGANDQLGTEKAIALGEVANMRNQRDAALDLAAQTQADFNALVPKVSRFYNKVISLRILVKDLRQTIRSLV